jgi:hypothetical protein
MTAVSTVTVYCEACPVGAEVATAGTALAARAILRARGWQVNVYRADADRRLDFCPVHRTTTR